MARTYFMDFERADETEVSVEYTISAYDPGNTYGPAESCYPPEGGEVEIIKVFNDAGPVVCTDDEAEKWSAYIAENHDHGDDYDDF
ncbi:hypothetical protein [Pseudaminobacter soli (ex Li et al. 2025)]|uniref:Uncharacterized protein n=1 Tax=Pseudaminobacter soli (ex Li et al. 2025) TaxID=1295366 RepID=A0A2P7SE95_9HYPH|nr:hypothetical protein [Mesorhizobium soli]PSJ60793.1 hypothetical protein C7I85_12180 [Mesorhizobium soli]